MNTTKSYKIILAIFGLFMIIFYNQCCYAMKIIMSFYQPSHHYLSLSNESDPQTLEQQAMAIAKKIIDAEAPGYRKRLRIVHASRFLSDKESYNAYLIILNALAQNRSFDSITIWCRDIGDTAWEELKYNDNDNNSQLGAAIENILRFNTKTNDLWVDGDYIFSAQCFKNIVKALVINTTIRALSCNFTSYNEDGKLLSLKSYITPDGKSNTDSLVSSLCERNVLFTLLIRNLSEDEKKYLRVTKNQLLQNLNDKVALISGINFSIDIWRIIWDHCYDDDELFYSKFILFMIMDNNMETLLAGLSDSNKERVEKIKRVQETINSQLIEAGLPLPKSELLSFVDEASKSTATASSSSSSSGSSASSSNQHPGNNGNNGQSSSSNSNNANVNHAAGSSESAEGDNHLRDRNFIGDVNDNVNKDPQTFLVSNYLSIEKQLNDISKLGEKLDTNDDIRLKELEKQIGKLPKALRGSLANRLEALKQATSGAVHYQAPENMGKFIDKEVSLNPEQLNGFLENHINRIPIGAPMLSASSMISSYNK